MPGCRPLWSGSSSKCFDVPHLGKIHVVDPARPCPPREPAVFVEPGLGTTPFGLLFNPSKAIILQALTWNTAIKHHWLKDFQFLIHKRISDFWFLDISLWYIFMSWYLWAFHATFFVLSHLKLDTESWWGSCSGLQFLIVFCCQASLFLASSSFSCPGFFASIAQIQIKKRCLKGRMHVVTLLTITNVYLFKINEYNI